ncbi:MAG: phosphate/phosphite/phosphonate ABC transporter substrate-binding protein [Gammaproteobacteria bacterium]|nr:phosphate/phosphite/phosphonate ABC transporter substrate-binding protein [Gammaproteobacteria bacterium]MDH5650419.1 phosphate/phosphite/phosphonate ABC transporter substrate-binding protein [Gammaproteobacteria bacterium]
MMTMSLTRTICIALLILCVLTGTAGAASKTLTDDKLVFGILPSRSTVNMFKRFAPLRDYLSKELHRTVIFETAPDYDIFLQRSKQRKYDFILTAPHFALMTLDTGKYEVSATYQEPLSAVLLVHKQSDIMQLNDLVNRSIATPPQQAIITMAGKFYLDNANLPGRPQYILTRTHSASLHAMLSKETDAAIVSSNVSRHAINKKMPVRILSQSPEIPGMALLVAGDLPAGLREKFGKLLINMHKNAKGRHILKQMNYPGYRKASRQDFEPVRPLLDKYWK